MKKVFIFVLIPHFYNLRTRLNTKMNKLSWQFVYTIPSLILFHHFADLHNISNLILLFLGVTLINYIYENGYIQNDCVTTKKETKPQLRLNTNEMDIINKYWTKIVLSRIIITFLLLFAYAYVSNSIANTIILTSLLIVLQVVYLIYNHIRNIWNLVLILPLSYIRFYGFIIPFVPFNEIGTFIFATILIYPLSKVLEFTTRKRFKLSFFRKLISNIDKFRILYYLIIIGFFLLIDINLIYIILATYYFIYRTVSFLVVNKKNLIQRRS